jgi:DNA-binding FrmR family transcriptional regulator
MTQPGGDDRSPVKQACGAGLRTIEGQVGDLYRMVADDEPCIDVVIRVSAVTSALSAVGLRLLEDHLQRCVAEAVGQSEDTASAKVREATAAISRLVVTGRSFRRRRS